MKYKDSNFSKFQDRQRDGFESPFTSKSDRQTRREQEHRLSLFYSKNLSKKIEKDWWINLSFGDRQQVETSYYGQKEMLEEDSQNMWANFDFFDTWDEWYDFVHTEYKPDRVKYRESKLKKIGL